MSEINFLFAFGPNIIALSKFKLNIVEVIAILEDEWLLNLPNCVEEFVLRTFWFGGMHSLDTVEDGAVF